MWDFPCERKHFYEEILHCWTQCPQMDNMELHFLHLRKRELSQHYSPRVNSAITEVEAYPQICTQLPGGIKLSSTSHRHLLGIGMWLQLCSKVGYERGLCFTLQCWLSTWLWSHAHTSREYQVNITRSHFITKVYKRLWYTHCTSVNIYTTYRTI